MFCDMIIVFELKQPVFTNPNKILSTPIYENNQTPALAAPKLSSDIASQPCTVTESEFSLIKRLKCGTAGWKPEFNLVAYRRWM